MIIPPEEHEHHWYIEQKMILHQIALEYKAMVQAVERELPPTKDEFLELADAAVRLLEKYNELLTTNHQLHQYIYDTEKVCLN